MARSFGVSPVDLNIGITAYLSALAVFIPISGWLADRFGARTCSLLGRHSGFIGSRVEETEARIVASIGIL